MKWALGWARWGVGGGHLLARAAGVGEAEAERGAHLDVGGGLVLDVLGEEGQRGVALVAHARVEHAHRQQGARLDVGVRGVEELVDLREAAVDVPEQQRAEGGGGGHHAVLLVLVEPLVALGEHELVGAEAHVDEAVDEGRGEVLPGRVDVRRRGGPLLEVRLVDLLGRLGLDHVQVARELEVLLRRVRAVHDAGELVVRLGAHAVPGGGEEEKVKGGGGAGGGGGGGGAGRRRGCGWARSGRVPCEHVGHLLLDHLVVAAGEDVRDQRHVLQLHLLRLRRKVRGEG